MRSLSFLRKAHKKYRANCRLLDGQIKIAQNRINRSLSRKHKTHNPPRFLALEEASLRKLREYRNDRSRIWREAIESMKRELITPAPDYDPYAGSRRYKGD